MATKPSTSIRVPDVTKQAIRKLSQDMGMNQTEIIALAIERLARTRFRVWLDVQVNDYDPAADQDGDYEFENWIKSSNDNTD